MKTTLLIAACAMLAVAPRVHAQQPVGVAVLNGDWTLNTEKSDNPQEKVRAAMRPATGEGGMGAMGGRGGVRGGIGGRRGGSRTGDTGGMGREGASADERGAFRAAMQEILFGGETVHIAGTESLVELQYAARRALSVNPNGAKTKMERFGVAEAEVKTEWKKNKLTIETEAGDGLSTKEEYEVKDEHGLKELEVNAQMHLPGGQTVKVKRIYELKPAGS